MLKGMVAIGLMHLGMPEDLTGLMDRAKLLGATVWLGSLALTSMPAHERMGLLGLRRISVVRPQRVGPLEPLPSRWSLVIPPVI